MKVGYLGPKGTFSYEACNKLYKDYEKISYKTISRTIDALNNNLVDKIVVPIENSQQGCVTETLDKLIESKDIYIIREENLKIKHNLMSSKKYKLEDIKEVYSHPQAVAQCREYLDKNLENASIIEVSSTALAAIKSLEKENSGCIGNIELKKEYDLFLLDRNIQDNDYNETKFWVLSKNKEEAHKKEKITIIFTTLHKPGALYHVLGIFDKYNLNLSKIESRPTKEKFGEYYFWIDIEIKNKDYQKAIEELKESVSFYKILGIY